MADASWNQFWAATTDANLAMVQGDPSKLKQVYSHREDITVLGGFGGFESGWKEVGARLDWAASQFRNGTFEQKEVSVVVGSDMAFTVTIERNEVNIAGKTEPSVLELRVTQIFRRDPDGWHMVHRHADPLVNKQAPE